MALSPEEVGQEEDQQLRQWARSPVKGLFAARLHKLSKSHEMVKAEHLRNEKPTQALYQQGRIDGVAEVLRLLDTYAHPEPVSHQPPY